MKASSFKGIDELKGRIKTKIRLSVHAKNVECSNTQGSAMLSVELFTYQKVVNRVNLIVL